MEVDFDVVIKYLEQPCLICNSKSEIYSLNDSCKLLFDLRPSAHSIPSLDELVIMNDEAQKLTQEILKNKGSGAIQAFVGEQDQADELIALDVKITHLDSLNVVPSVFLVQITRAETITASDEILQGLGSYTGDISHAISNPLAIIRINCDTMDIKIQKNGTIDPELLSQKIEKLNDATNRITEEIDKLKQLSRDLRQGNNEALVEAIETTKKKPDTPSGDEDFH